MAEVRLGDIYTGCGVCMSFCPEECIKRVSDCEGFLYLEIDTRQRSICNVPALRGFLGENCGEDLLTRDLLCYGVPSPGIFAKYVGFLEQRYHSGLDHINFRPKRKGWELGTVVTVFDDGKEIHLNGTESDVYVFRARRWVVERTHSWMNRYRRLLIRWEKKRADFLNMIYIACSVITPRASGVSG